MHDKPPSAVADFSRSSACAAFFVSRWRAEVQLDRILWRDMLLVGTAINLLLGFAGLMLFANEAPTALAAGVYFSPLPYNVFLYTALWRTAERTPGSFATLARVLGFGWLVASIVL
jgi:hypothetical protein